MSSIEVLERVLLAMAAAIETRMREAIGRGAGMIEREAKREIGHYQRTVGSLPRWPRLRPSTLAEKIRLGYRPPDNPLLRTGEMRARIRHRGSEAGEKIEARVGVNGVVAVVQERGGHVPAGSYLERAARRKAEAVVAEMRRQLARALRGP